jgi:hypothetical protein
MADLQDHLLIASTDLDRLQRLLHDASESLLIHFHHALVPMQQLMAQAATLSNDESRSLQHALQTLGSAVTALQFQDMATQLINHTTQRLRGCAYRLAGDLMGNDEDGAAVVAALPQRPNPVTQDEMDAGSIELF